MPSRQRGGPSSKKRGWAMHWIEEYACTYAMESVECMRGRGSTLC
jgi:hypothetical protein